MRFYIDKTSRVLLLGGLARVLGVRSGGPGGGGVGVSGGGTRVVGRWGGGGGYKN